MKCSRCQAENPPGTRFCGQCGTPLAAVCPSCGTSNPVENKFCGQCATPLDKPSQPRFAAPESYTPKHLAQKILISKAALEGEAAIAAKIEPSHAASGLHASQRL